MYRFRLQRVLEYRRRQAEACQREFLHVQQLLCQEEARLQALRDEERAHRERCDALQGMVLLREELILLLHAYQSLVQQLDAQEVVTMQMSHRVAEARHTLLAAQRQEKTIDTLRENGQRSYTLDYAKREQALLDERTIMRLHHGHEAQQ